MPTIIECMTGVCIKSDFFSNAPTLELFPPRHRVALLYGKNGCGKTTLAQGFRNYMRADAAPEVELSPKKNGVSIPVTTGQSGKFFVFDEEYVASKIKFKDAGLEAIVLFGEQINLEAQIEQNLVDITAKQVEVDQQSKEFERFMNADDVTSPDYWISLITKELGKIGGWAKTDSRINGNTIRTAIPPAIDRIGQLTPDKPQEELQGLFDDRFQAYTTASIDSTRITTAVSLITIIDDRSTESRELLAKSIARPQWTKREQELFNLLGVHGLDSAKTFLSNTDHTFCDRCLQPISDNYRADVLDELERILNREVEEFKSKLKKLLLPETTNTAYEVFSELRSYSETRDCLNEYIKAALAHNAAIQAKIDNPFEPLVYDDAIEVMAKNEALNKALTILERDRVLYNRSIDERSAFISELVSMNDALASYAIHDMYTSLQRQRRAKLAAETQLIQRKTELESLLTQQVELNFQRKNFRLAAEDINNSLEYIFYCKGRLILELGTDGYYHLNVNEHAVPPSKVSCGERNALALSYFFTEIASNMNANEVYSDEVFLVIDDPVSSFDFENRIGILSLLRWKLEQVLEGCGTSKVMIMTHDIGTAFDLDKAFKDIKERLKGTNKSADYQLLRLEDYTVSKLTDNHRNEYTLLLGRIFEYAKTGLGDGLVIGNIMRRVLEAFATFSYKKGIDNVSNEDAILEIIPETQREYFKNLMCRLVLNGESHYRDQIQGMRDYSFTNFLSEAEKKRTARDILCFMFLLNKKHVIAHLPDAAVDLATWCSRIG